MASTVATGGQEQAAKQQAELAGAHQEIVAVSVDRAIHQEQLCFYLVHHYIYHHQCGIIYIASDTVSKLQLVCHIC